ncbi:hypothetical protein CDD81_6497 [Ophiocordyceps australis]|uniref:Uncharacterized protein n=1 Tax=Ophiocordyceps australis TaxID=1399860 RepID=A0A2C5YGP8_9HYPO|nr:hypothetical protein CDD81_6497 [Ophiocordyceps australis]
MSDRRKNQLDAITKFYSGTRIKFRLKSIDLTINQAWATGHDTARMRQSLYMGGNRDLNLYFLEVTDLDRSLEHSKKTSVFCTFPYSAWWAILSTAEPEHDGCLIAMNVRAGTVATALQSWFGNSIPVASTCDHNDCGPVFALDDTSMLNALVVLNRAVPVATKWSRLRLYEALDV